MDMKLIIPKQEEPVEYFLISSISDVNVDAALDTYSNAAHLPEADLTQVVKQEPCDDIKPVYEDYMVEEAQEEEEPIDPLALLSKEESDKEASEYEPDTEYENNDEDNDETDEDWSAEKNTTTTTTRKRRNGPNIATVKEKYKGRQISVIEDEDENMVFEGPPYVCNICSLSFPIEKSLRAHRSIHKGKTLRCEVCKRVFKNTWHIHEHMKSHNEPHLSCPFCPKKFALKKSLMRHQVHHREKTLECDYCRKKFRQKGQLHEHIKIHRERTKRYQCEICDMAYYEQRTLNRHMKHIHSNFQRKRFRCPNTLCDKSYSSIPAFRMHACVDGRRPQDMLLISCAQCDKRFGDKFEMRQHTKRVHESNRANNYHCPACGKTFLYSSWHSFVLHVAQKCARSLTYQCDYCQTVLRNKPKLLQHFVRQHSIDCKAVKEGHCCPHCNRIFTAEAYLNQHIKRSHTDPKCVHCYKTFLSKAGWERHQLTCIPKRTFNKSSQDAAVRCKESTWRIGCPRCHRTFCTEANLNQHMKKVHTDPKCEHCLKMFQTKGGFKKHQQFCIPKKTFDKYSQHATVIGPARTLSFPCVICGCSFITETNLLEHRTEVHLEKNFELEETKFRCTTCGKSFTSRCSLSKHRQRIHKNKRDFTCSSCKGKFIGEEMYHDHLANSECGRKRGIQQYQCIVCSKIYRSNIRLRLHFDKEHGTGRKYVYCDICNREYVTKKALQKHLEAGDHRTSWECEFCSKNFTLISAYKTHKLYCASK